MESKQTLKVGDSVRVIKPSSHYLFKEGFIEKKGDVYDWEVSIDDEIHYYDNKDLQLITPKKEVKKYTKEERDSMLEWWNNFNGEEKTIKLIEIYKNSLAKSTPKKKSKEIKFEEIEEVEEYFNRGELSTTINLLIRNQKKLQDTINLLIKNK